MFWFKSREEKLKIQQQEETENGYRWAAVKLLKGKCPKEVYSYVECSINFNDHSCFDIGIETALKDWKNKTGEEYEYM